jgi:hypothetical protein
MKALFFLNKSVSRILERRREVRERESTLTSFATKSNLECYTANTQRIKVAAYNGDDRLERGGGEAK